MPLGGQVELGPGQAAGRPRGAGRRVDRHRLQQRQVDHHAAVADAVARHRVAAAAHGDRQLALAGEADRRCTSSAPAQRAISAGERSIAPFQTRRASVVALFSGPQQRAAEPPAQVVHRMADASVRHGRHGARARAFRERSSAPRCGRAAGPQTPHPAAGASTCRAAEPSAGVTRPPGRRPAGCGPAWRGMTGRVVGRRAAPAARDASKPGPRCAVQHVEVAEERLGGGGRPA